MNSGRKTDEENVGGMWSSAKSQTDTSSRPPTVASLSQVLNRPLCVAHTNPFQSLVHGQPTQRRPAGHKRFAPLGPRQSVFAPGVELLTLRRERGPIYEGWGPHSNLLKLAAILANLSKV